ncbi:class I SAM-dependent methyltransferase [Luteimonas sp. MC1750]|uniref:class I SAM-dependent methyltransferase n=1 Tax=Luteimonas sp. MC1750 TaxID=2799326 RepID=UPI0018F0C921|nr:class I SAM-dependent methyltransferase [Luteimonas sp. MC1750]MBJ6985300.1 class I SAM-dependent methyltransferase [Luteimonas sp. MC1750]QQO05435.1 class I SAM-dependent methyltransferase [Luteimonas sp. MC1750]
MSTEPRWGAKNRDRKAAAILRTMRMICGDTVVGGRWLDAGCGSGGIARALADQVQYVEGVDPDSWTHWRTFEAETENLRFHVGECDGPEPPLPAARYDIVVCNQVYEHVRDPFALLVNIHRMLKRDGHCYFAGPNLWWPIEPHVFWPFVHWLPRTTAHRCMTALGSHRARELDAYSSSYFRLARWFREAGFEYRNVFAERLEAGFPEDAMSGRAFGLAARAGRALAPVQPGFVFHLRHAR